MKQLILFFTIIIATTFNAVGQCNVTIDQSGPVCHGMCSGFVTANATGIPPYNYQWDNLSSSQSLVEICAGNYLVTITDSLGCVATASATITEYPQLIFTVDSFKNVTCYGMNNGEAWGSVTGGLPPYNYYWNPDNLTSHATGLIAMNYYPQVVDSAGCLASAMLNIISPTEILLNANIYQPICFSNSGFIITNPSGGTPAGGAGPVYNYLWDYNSTTTSGITSLPSGIYYITVTDSIGCSVSQHFVLNTSDGPIPTISWSDVTCNGLNNGIVTNITNTTPVATCLWSTGATSLLPYPQNLSPGDYWLRVTTPAGCNGYDYFTILEPSALNDIPTQNDPFCYNDTNGFIYTSVTGGTPFQVYPYYNYLWNDASNDFKLDPIPAGLYSVTITDLNGCTLSENFNIVNPLPLIIDSLPITNVSCFGMNDGIVEIYASGGTPEYYYSMDSINWDSYDTINWISPGNNYYVIVKDKNHCYTSTSYFNIYEPTDLNVISSSVDPTCVGNNGSATIDNITGGTIPYSIIWDAPPYSGNSISNLSQGTYWATITDAHACEKNIWFDLFQSGTLPVLTGINMYGITNTLPANESKIYLFSPSNTGAATMDTVSETTNSSTTWEFAGLQPGVYFVKANLLNPSSFPNLLNSYYDSTFDWQNAIPIILNCNDTTNVILNMFSITPITTGNGSVSGTVLMVPGNKSTNAIGEPVPGAEILIEQEPNDVPVQCVFTDTNGYYSFTGLNAGGGYHLIVQIPGFPLLSTYQNITVTANDTLPNLNFLVDSTSGGGIFKDSASYVSLISINGITLDVYPNPFISNINVKLNLNSSSDVSIELYDELGHTLLKTLRKNILEGENIFNIAPKTIKSGTYYLMVKIGETILVKKLISNKK